MNPENKAQSTRIRIFSRKKFHQRVGRHLCLGSPRVSFIRHFQKHWDTCGQGLSKQPVGSKKVYQPVCLATKPQH